MIEKRHVLLVSKKRILALTDLKLVGRCVHPHNPVVPNEHPI
jgi:hypothetical protein